MLKPADNEVLDSIQSRYSLVIAVAKRARTIAENAEFNGEILIEKPVNLAVDEISGGKYRVIESPEVTGK